MSMDTRKVLLFALQAFGKTAKDEAEAVLMYATALQERLDWCRDGAFLGTDELASRWGVSKDAVGRLRRRGKGPKCIKVGSRYRYHIADVIKWEEGPAAPDYPFRLKVVA